MPKHRGKSKIEWNYDIEGEGDALLFIHGWGVDRRIWRQQTKYFSSHYCSIAVDLPGHGNSTFEKVPLEIKAREIHEILCKENIKKVTLIGSSFGGMVALKVYELYPEMINRIVFVGSMPKFSKSEDYPHGIDVGQFRKLNGQLSSDYPSIVNVFFRSLFTKEERETRRFKWLQKFRQTDEVPLRQALVDYLDLLEGEDLRHVLKESKVPMQFINGTGDSICHKGTVGYLKEVSPHSKFEDFHQCGHFPFLSKAHEFNECVHEFLKEDIK